MHGQWSPHVLVSTDRYVKKVKKAAVSIHIPHLNNLYLLKKKVKNLED